MAWIVEYVGRDQRPAKSPAFGDERLAASYARTVKAGKVVPVAVDAPQVAVQTCPPPEAVQAQRAQDRAASLSERCAEAYLEAGSQARLGGASSADVLDYATAAAASVLREAQAEGVACAGGCGRTVRGGMTTCRNCSRGM